MIFIEYVVYQVMFIDRDMRYIGRSQEYEKRKRAHLNMLRTNSHNNNGLQCDFNELGEEYIIFTILHKFDNKEKSISCEQEYIDNKDILKYNISDSATSGGDIFTDNPRKEELRKMRIEQMSGEGNHQYGKKKTEKMISAVKKANSKKIMVDGIIYSSLTEYNNKTGIGFSTISYRLNSDGFKNYIYIN